MQCSPWENAVNVHMGPLHWKEHCSIRSNVTLKGTRMLNNDAITFSCVETKIGHILGTSVYIIRGCIRFSKEAVTI